MMIDPTPEHESSKLLIERLNKLESAQGVRQTIARYMQLCDVPAPFGTSLALQALFTDDAIWEGVGSKYAQKFGRLVGSTSIAAMLASYLPPSPHFVFNAHFLTSEDIKSDVVSANGQWLMQQVSSYEDGRSELIVARLNIDFALVDDHWKISHFRTERLAEFPLGASVPTAEKN
ncbi:nuclear transport factor 2 family protein [Pseudomonas sp. PSKL.D1]|uniref:nuclear transport factor 2 family protein n=1 Tax=Pseudomonas sp. PSKL.D1 TaxID=3029060 RepID=UPI0023810F23|nr:nuclear transport factor 2 family protein [Pseudomonas sp. PSKL.D1]WDY59071.1 nuclear transport factor 2 family protein [Pseudomonas sp. PSKL.D1]